MQMRLIRSEVVELRGADAIAFAQAQFMNDVAPLADGDWQWSGWLTPKGRLIAFFAVARSAADRLLLWLPDGGAEALVHGLDRFRFRAKIAIRIAPDWTSSGFVGERWTRSGTTENEAVVLPFPNDAEGRTRELVLTREPGDPAQAPAVTDSIDDEDRWRLADLYMRVPYIAAGTPASEQFIPQWLSLDRLNAFSLKKGCYPGQEIVARMHYLGQSKRSALVLRGESTKPSPLAHVLDAKGERVGQIVWAQSVGNAGWHALAVITNEGENGVAVVVDAGPLSRGESAPDNGG